MSTATTTRAIDLAQLGAELADPPAPLSMSDDGTERTITCHDDTITQTQLQAAVDAHVPAPPPPSAASLLQAQVDELSDLTFDLLTLMEGP
jgi:hypothetical protein